MRGLIIVDVQHDFLPGGALAVPNGDEVIPEIVRLEQTGRERGVYGPTITTADNHPEGTKHFEKWPVHCVQGTHGQEVHPDIYALAAYHIVKGETMEDDGYSAFEGMDVTFGRSINEILGTWKYAQRPDSIQAVDVVGLATDYCVKATALDAVKNGYETRVFLGATRPVAADTGNAAVAEMQAAGVRVVPPAWTERELTAS